MVRRADIERMMARIEVRPVPPGCPVEPSFALNDAVTLHLHDGRYGFDRHKGYATRDHLDAVSRYGYSPAHRRSFRPPTLFDTLNSTDTGIC